MNAFESTSTAAPHLRKLLLDLCIKRAVVQSRSSSEVRRALAQQTRQPHSIRRFRDTAWVCRDTRSALIGPY